MRLRECGFNIIANATLSSDIEIDVCAIYKSTGGFDYFRLDFGSSLSVCLTRIQMAELYEKITKVNVDKSAK